MYYCLLVCGVAKRKMEDGNWVRSVLVDVNYLFCCFAVCFTEEEVKLQAGTFRREPRGILPRGCLVTPQETPRLAAEWSLEHNIMALYLFW